MNLYPNIATKIVSDYNETIEFCKECIQATYLSTYRPNVDLLRHRSYAITEVMHFRSHQSEY